MGTSMILAFMGLKVALALLFWRAAVKGFALGERIEARKRAEREASRSPEPAHRAPDGRPVRVPRPAA